MVEKFKERAVSAPIESRTPGPGGAVWRVTAQALDGVARLTGAMADRAAEAAGKREGITAGMDPEFRPRRDGTIRGEAYDAAALRSHSAMLDGKLREEMAALFETAGHDAVAFDKGVASIREKYLSGIPDELKPDWIAGVDRQRFPYDREIARKRAATTLSEEAASLTSLLATREADYGRMAYQAGLDEKADVYLSAEAEDILKTLTQYGPKQGFTFEGVAFAPDDKRAGLLDPEMMAQKMLQLADVAGVNRVKGAFDRTGDLAGQVAFLKEFRDDYAGGEGVAKTMSLKSVEALEGWMEARIREQLADARARDTALRAEIADIRSQLSDYRGFAGQSLTPPAGVIDALRGRAMATGDPAILADVNGLERVLDLASSAVKVAPVQLAAAVAQRRAALQAGATPQDAAELKVLEDTLSGMSKALQSDPMSYASAAGVIALQPLDMGMDEEGRLAIAPGSFAARRAQAQAVSARYGVPMRPFTEDEAMLAASVDRGGGENLLTVARQIASEFGSDAPEAFAQIGDKAPLLGHLGALLSSGSPIDVAEAAARGQALMSEKTGVGGGVTRSQKTSSLQTLQVDQIFGSDPQTRAAIERTADAIYAGRKGLAAEFDEPAYRQAVQEAAGASFVDGQQWGGIVRYRDDRVVLPPWLRADRLDDFIGDMDAQDFAVAGGGYAPVDGAGRPLGPEALRRARLTSIGPGVYHVSLKDPDGEDPQWVASMDPAAPDARYILDLNAVRASAAKYEWLPPSLVRLMEKPQ